ncbi:Mitogen-activated protein kinase kinase kinase [Aphelenchoides fujianensis]|nr:Mitogen-activated protein kinase kinase kinase [Aphelenchoides fujianensis]
MQALHVDVNAGTSSSHDSAPPDPSHKTSYPQVDYREIVFPDFQHIQRLGRGSYGTVVQAVFRGRKHDNIIKLYAAFYGEQSGLILELMEGGSLHDLLHQHKHIQYKAVHVLGWAQQEREYVHRDLKPSNMLLTNDFITLKLCDFVRNSGQTAHFDDEQPEGAPEVFRGKKYDQKCDVFSIGILLWEMISRRQPFNDWDTNAYSILWQVSEGKRPNLIDNCPPIIMDLIKRCWAAKPRERPDVAELSETIDILCEIYPNRYAPLVDRTTHHQAFAHPVNWAQRPPQMPPQPSPYLQHSNIPYPTPPATNTSTLGRPPPSPAPPIPPPPLIRHHRNSSDHDGRSRNSDGYYPPHQHAGNSPYAPHQQANGYAPNLSAAPNAMPFTPCVQQLHPNQTSPPPQFGHSPSSTNLTVPCEIGSRRHSEPPGSDNESVHSMRTKGKKIRRVVASKHDKLTRWFKNP